jgi:pimeloyl-ACP methyl ester carboxylesterase
MLTALIPKYRRLVPGQLDSLQAIDELGVRLGTYAQIRVPVVLLGGDRSPAHLGERLDALERVIPNTQRVVMHNRDHGADLKHPEQVASVIEDLAGMVLAQNNRKPPSASHVTTSRAGEPT